MDSAVLAILIFCGAFFGTLFYIIGRIFSKPAQPPRPSYQPPKISPIEIQKKDDLTKEVAAQEERLKQVKTRIEEQKQAAESLKAEQLELVEKEYALQLARLKREKEVELEMALKEIENGELGQKLRNFKAEIQEAHQTYKSLRDMEKRNAAEQAKELTINLSNNDLEDIQILSSVQNRLNRGDILKDILWTIYYQQPLQVLRAKLVGGNVTKKVCGIYKITNSNERGKCYIGQSKDISNRLTEHVKAGLKGDSSKFYKDMKFYGPHNFIYEIIEECKPEDLDKREQYWIQFFDAVDHGYNTKEIKSVKRIS